MDRYLLDTNVVSEARKGGRADPGVTTWLASVRGNQLHISVLVLGEIRQGVERLQRRGVTGVAVAGNLHHQGGGVPACPSAPADRSGAGPPVPGEPHPGGSAGGGLRPGCPGADRDG